MIYYLRDSNSGLIGLKYNDTTYYYQKNAQEDITGIVDSNFNIVATYSYDAWGNILSIKDANGNVIIDNNHIAHINPYRYRSYYYDEETKLYYLNSRYYNPIWSRFINVDDILGINKDILSYNIYIYGSNNFIINYEYDGKSIGKLMRSAINRMKNKLISIKNNKKNSIANTNKSLPTQGPSNGWLEIPGESSPKQRRWYDENGDAIHDRDYSNHGNSKKHPKVPHDHEWNNNERSGWKDPDYQNFPEQFAYGSLTLIGGYLIIKWGIAIVASVPTGGGSLVAAGVLP